MSGDDHRQHRPYNMTTSTTTAKYYIYNAEKKLKTNLSYDLLIYSYRSAPIDIAPGSTHDN